MTLYASSETRKNLHYIVLHTEDDQKYNTLRDLLVHKKCPAIIVELLSMRSGDALHVNLPYLSVAKGKVLKLSAAAMNKVNRLIAKDYHPTSAVIRFIVAWKGENDEGETPVILPDIHFTHA